MSQDNNAPDRSRNWMFTINRPLEKSLSKEIILETINNWGTIRYYCYSEEIGNESEKHHCHFYIVWENPIYFTSAKKKFPLAHIDFPRGTPEEIRDYIFKQGKWENSEKETTNIKESHVEYGECPVYQKGKRTDLSGLYEMIKDGYSNYQIFERDSNLIKYVDRIDKIRKTVQSELVKNQWRNIETEYIWGITGTGKTRYVMEKYGYANVYRVTDYLHPFDSYQGQDIILFEEFRSSIRVDDMLKYLDGYPVELACRYSNQQALFTKVYICTNIDLRAQYPNIQQNEGETWKAFLRRIHRVTVFESNDTKYTMSTYEYLKNYFQFFNNPFENDQPYRIEQETLNFNKETNAL